VLEQLNPMNLIYVEKWTEAQQIIVLPSLDFNKYSEKLKDANTRREMEAATIRVGTHL
jgi:hypothetical protein